VTFNVLIF